MTDQQTIADAIGRDLAAPMLIERLAADAETLEIPVSFASDRIIDDPWLGPVRLSMEPGAADLTAAMERGIPVRLMHERGLPPARIHAVAIADGKMRGTMRFSRTERGQALYQDAADGILTDLSVGAELLAIREEPDHLVATRWRPREVSIVDEGADQSVGINRAARPIPPAAPAAQPPEVTTMAHAETVAPEPTSPALAPNTLAREAANIAELGRYVHSRYPDLGAERMADDFIQFGRSFDDFKAAIWPKVAERKAKEPAVAQPSEIGLTKHEAREFSIVRACNAYLTRNWKGAEFELEASRAVADRMGREAKGFFVPLEVQRTMSAGNLAAGGALVGTDHRADLFIDSLRAMAVAFQAGAQSLPGLVGNVSIPKLTGNASWYWITEGADGTASDAATGAVTLMPRTLAGATAMTRRLLQQSSPAVEQLVRNDLIRGAALALDLAIFEGTGAAGQPLGIVNVSGVNTQAVSTDGSPTWAEIVGFESAVATDNALDGSLAYVMTPAVRGTLKTTSKDTGSGIFIMGDNGTVNGYRALASTQLATHRVVFGNYSDVLVGFWGVLDIKPDEATNAASGGLVLRAFQDVDVAVRHAESFCYAT